MTAILFLCLLVMSAQAGTYIDNFDDGNLDGWEVMDTKNQGVKWTVENGVLICNRPSIWDSFLRFGEEEWQNYSIECDAKLVQIFDAFHSMGLDLRLPKALEKGLSPFVDFSLWDSKTANISVWLNDVKLNGSSKAFGCQLDHWYRLKAIASEENFEFYVDGELILSFSDLRASAGCVALNAGGCLAHFDNVVITGDDVPDNSSAVSAPNKLAATWGQIRSQQN